MSGQDIRCAVIVAERLQQKLAAIQFEDDGDREALADARCYLDQTLICLRDIVEHQKAIAKAE